MSAQVSNHNFTNIGRMFARQNVPTVYGAQKSAAGVEPEETAEQVDRVSLSPFAPRPLSANMFESAMRTARTIGSNGKLSSDDLDALREDRIFAAVAALAIVGDDGSENVERPWPGGIPVPTREELDVARRRLAQRLQSVENTQDADTVQQDRLDLLRKVGKRDFLDFAASGTTQIAAVAAAS